MNSRAKETLIASSLELLAAAGRTDTGKDCRNLSAYTLLPIAADGSSRIFYRLVYRGASLCIGVMPADHAKAAHDEARSMAAIGRHLFSRKVPVPEILAFDEQTGLVLLEDCGDIKLHDRLQQRKPVVEAGQEICALYRELLDGLAYMQVQGAEGFDDAWCHDTARYDTELMIERESLYFLSQFWQGLLGQEAPDGIEEEFADIAFNAGRGQLHLFLHRDFQSRNVMVVGTSLKIIDFQGGRLGPPGYDLASLLIDPYAALSFSFQEEMRSHYLRCLQSFIDYDEKVFLRQYTYLQLQRNLQILGAFAFLYVRRRKPFFKEYIGPALCHLGMLLDKQELQAYTCLRRLAAEARQRMPPLLA